MKGGEISEKAFLLHVSYSGDASFCFGTCDPKPQHYLGAPPELAFFALRAVEEKKKSAWFDLCCVGVLLLESVLLLLIGWQLS